VDEQTRTYGGNDAAAARAWQDFCQMLLAASAFLYVE
jgi:hypothetical protein